jgi:succinate dehydrogenase / fumarate reductase flavoprotein subunit
MATRRSTERGRARRTIVVGGGIAGAALACELCSRGVPVLLVSSSHPVRAPSSACHGGIADPDGTVGDGSAEHFDDTVRAGAFLAHQAPVMAMAEGASELVELLDRLGVPFDRTPEGLRRLTRSAGSRVARTVRSGFRTGQQVLLALCRSLRRHASVEVSDGHGATIAGESLLEVLAGWDLVRLVLDDNGVAVGVICEQRQTHEVRSFIGDGVCLATGDYSRLFARSAGGLGSTGTATAIAFRQGAALVDPELVQLTPTGVLGAHKALVLGDAALGLGARFFVPKDARDPRNPAQIPEQERDYLLERLYPNFGDLVADRLACRALRAATGSEGRAYLDLSHLPEAVLEEHLTGELEAYELFTGASALAGPLRVSPVVKCVLGGLFVDHEADAQGRLVTASPRNHATTIPGLYAVGAAASLYHGACQLSDNAALASVFGARLAAHALCLYRSALVRSAFDLPGSVFERALSLAEEQSAELCALADHEGATPARYEAELAELMLERCAFEADREQLARLPEELERFTASARHACAAATASGKSEAQARLELDGLVLLAKACALSASERAREAQLPEETKLRRHSFVRCVDGAPCLAGELEYPCAGRVVRASSEVDRRLLPSDSASDGGTRTP